MFFDVLSCRAWTRRRGGSCAFESFATLQMGGVKRCVRRGAAALGGGPLPHGLVEPRRRRGGDVERADPAAHGQADHAVTELAGAGAQPLLLAAEAEDDLAGEVDLPRRIARGVGPIDPDPRGLEPLDLVS